MNKLYYGFSLLKTKDKVLYYHNDKNAILYEKNELFYFLKLLKNRRYFNNPSFIYSYVVDKWNIKVIDVWTFEDFKNKHSKYLMLYD